MFIDIPPPFTVIASSPMRVTVFGLR